MRRFDSVDVMRAVAIVLMVVCHFIIYMVPDDGSEARAYLFGNHICGDVAGPLFVLLVGLSQALSLGRKPDTGPLLNATGIRMLSRAGFVLAVGIVHALLAHGPSGILETDVLPFIALTLVALVLLRRAPTGVLLAVAAAFFLAAPILRGQLGYLRFWGAPIAVAGLPHLLTGWMTDPAQEYHATATIRTVVASLVLTGYYPLFPWLTFPLVGYAIGRGVVKSPGDARWDRAIGLVGVACFCLGLAIAGRAAGLGLRNVEGGYAGPLAFFPLSPSLFLVQLGVCLALFGACRRLFDRTDARPSLLMRSVRRLSRYSLSIYVGHHLIIAAAIAAFARHTWAGAEYEDAVVPAWIALDCASTVLILLPVVLAWWDRCDGRFGLEWLQARILSRRVSPCRELFPEHRGRICR